MAVHLVNHVPDEHPRKREVESAVRAALAALVPPKGECQLELGGHDPLQPPGDERIRIRVLTPTSIRAGVIGPSAGARAIAFLIQRLLA